MVNVETVIIIVVVIIFALSFGFCCHFLSSSKQRRDELARRYSRPTEQITVTTDVQRNTGRVYMLHFQGTNSNNSDTNPAGADGGQNPSMNESEENAPDPIVESGPPPYSGLETDIDSVEPRLPPPSYEDALRISIENLATPREQRIERSV